ncbi:hypothetical protein L2E82_06702 [Cichorium intybus]|uniref:Uncharacterized protein n=1 Tax=Cichorium intybus TaxID=13427 RepID=A0ACB9HBU3_CICIN|nr:hypothetical protein L2E82_06702 [Cichorium intybus]
MMSLKGTLPLSNIFITATLLVLMLKIMPPQCMLTCLLLPSLSKHIRFNSSNFTDMDTGTLHVSPTHDKVMEVSSSRLSSPIAASRPPNTHLVTPIAPDTATSLHQINGSLQTLIGYVMVLLARLGIVESDVAEIKQVTAEGEQGATIHKEDMSFELSQDLQPIAIRSKKLTATTTSSALKSYKRMNMVSSIKEKATE